MACYKKSEIFHTHKQGLVSIVTAYHVTCPGYAVLVCISEVPEATQEARSRVQDRDEGVVGRNEREKYVTKSAQKRLGWWPDLDPCRQKVAPPFHLN